LISLASAGDIQQFWTVGPGSLIPILLVQRIV